MKRVKSGSLNQKLLDTIKKAGGKFSEEAKKKYAKGNTPNSYYHSDHFDNATHTGGIWNHMNMNNSCNGKNANEIHIDDLIRGKHPWQGTCMDDNGWIYIDADWAKDNKEDIDPDKFYHAEKIHPQSLLTLYGWTGIWNSLNTPQKMKVFRFVYNVENAVIIE
jgi:hypothetical protein